MYFRKFLENSICHTSIPMKLMRRKINEKSDKDEHSQEERTMRSLKETNFELSISTMNSPTPFSQNRCQMISFVALHDEVRVLFPPPSICLLIFLRLRNPRTASFTTRSTGTSFFSPSFSIPFSHLPLSSIALIPSVLNHKPSSISPPSFCSHYHPPPLNPFLIPSTPPFLKASHSPTPLSQSLPKPLQNHPPLITPTSQKPAPFFPRCSGHELRDWF